MIEKEFVPYELALKLKQLGFDESCFGHYSNGEFVYSSHTNNTMQRFRYAAPLYQQAFRWFRENYGLRIRNYGAMNYSGEVSEHFEIFRYAKGTSDKALSIRVGALTYEEAELECLKKLIETVKNGK